MVKMDPPKLAPPGTNFLIDKNPPVLILLQKYGLPLKNLDHLTQMEKYRPFTYKFGPVAYLGGLVRFWKLFRRSKFSSTQLYKPHSLMTVDKHRFALIWLVYSRNKFFRVGPNISEEFIPGGTNLRGVQIKRDGPQPCTVSL